MGTSITLLHSKDEIFKVRYFEQGLMNLKGILDFGDEEEMRAIPLRDQACRYHTGHDILAASAHQVQTSEDICTRTRSVSSEKQRCERKVEERVQ